MSGPQGGEVPRHVLVVLNPAANHGEAARLAAPLRELVGTDPAWTIRVTTSAREATSIVAECGAEVGTVVSVGGDGTVNEVVNGLMTHPAASRPALAAVPAGSGNDFPRLMGLPRGLGPAVLSVHVGARRRIDVGDCNGTWFVNAVSLGLDAQVTARAAEVKAATGRSGFGLYLSSLMHVLFRELSAYDVSISFDGGPATEARAMLVAVGNGRTYGGGFRVTPDAEPDDGLLDTLVLDELGLGETLWRLPFFVAGAHTRMRPVHMGRHRSLVVGSAVPMPGQIDGEVVASDRFEIRVEPGALEVVVPS